MDTIIQDGFRVVKTPSVWLPVVLVLLVSAPFFLITGYLVGVSSNKKLAEITVPVTPILTSAPTEMATSPSVVSLKKYSSSFEKLSFMYPSEWKLSSTAQSQSNMSGGDAIDMSDPNGKVRVSWVSGIEDRGYLSTKRAIEYLFYFGKNNGGFSTALIGNSLETGTKAEAQAIDKLIF